VPRRSRRRLVGKWEQIEQEARERELKELERELQGEHQQERGGKPQRKGRRRQRQRRVRRDAPDAGTSRDNGTEHPASNG
jgi:hypothetical protein